MSANLVMDLGMVVKNKATGNDCLSNVDASLTSASLDSESGPNSSGTPVSTVPENQPASAASSTANCAVDSSSAVQLTTSLVAAKPKIADSTAPFAANSLRSVAPKMQTQVHLPASGLNQPTLIVGPAVSAPGCIASPRKTVTVLPAGVRSPSQGPLAVISARPVAPAGQTVNLATRSPAKVTVLSLPKTSTVPGQFVTVVPSSGSTTVASPSGVNNKTTAVPYKVLIRPSSAVSK